jgi:hypothetical protein
VRLLLALELDLIDENKKRGKSLGQNAREALASRVITERLNAKRGNFAMASSGPTVGPKPFECRALIGRKG